MTPDLGDQRKRSSRLRGMLRGLAFGSVALNLGCTVSNPEAATETPQDANPTAPDTSIVAPDAAATMLDRVAAIVVPNCAVSGCHDAQTMEHGMDLSTGSKIYASWVNQLGLDHCRNMGRTRVVPGSPETSLVMTMITGALCEAWPRMPPPPRTALTTEQIEVVRAWIGAGAPPGAVDSGAGDGGSDVADVSADDEKDISIDATDEPSADVSTDATYDTGDAATNDAMDDAANDATDDATNDDVTSDAASDMADATDDADACNGVPWQAPSLRGRVPSLRPVGECTDTTPCGAGLMCIGSSCSDAWQCIPHLQGPGGHPCPPDDVPYCGCDGVTFMSPLSCADRPWAFQGACTDGVSCDVSGVRCGEIPPTCAAGQVPSVDNGSYGYCVDIKWCRCDATTKCPAPYTCGASTQRCSAPTRDQ
jgi:hypothetical protein